MKRRINKKKLLHEVLCLILVVLGIVIFVCNWTKTIPGFDTKIESAISAIIAYGFFIGPMLSFIAGFVFWEVRNTKYPRRAR